MIKVENLSKDFYVYKKAPGLLSSIKGLFKREIIRKKALDQVSLQVQEGEILGLVGANGAGKTTLVKILSGIIHPSSGKVDVLGFTPWERNNSFRGQMSLIMGQKASLWWDLPAADCFLLLREIYQIPMNQFQQDYAYLLDSLLVRELTHIPIRKLSLGERMKMELIAALLHRPKVVYLDEPTIGLDLTSQKAIRRFLLEYRQKYRPAMIITSHYMEDIESLCERIVIIKGGKFIYDGALRKLSNVIDSKSVHFQFEESISEQLLSEFPAHCILEKSEYSIKVKIKKEDLSNMTSHILQQYKIHDLSIEEVDMADIIEEIIRCGL